MMPKGMFIAFAGIDGAGKTTTAAAVAKLLGDGVDNVDYLDGKRPRFSQPYVQTQADRLRAALWDPDGDQYLLGFRHYLFLSAAWFEMLDRCLIEPALDDGRTIVTDGWVHKSAARSALRAPHVSATECRAAYLRLTRPDLTIMLDIRPEEALARKAEFTRIERGGSDGVAGDGENGFVAYQNRVREVLLRMADDEGWLLVDPAGLTADEVAEQVVGEIRRVRRMT
jgi:dTMP kinase